MYFFKKRFCQLPQRSGTEQAGSQGGGEEEDYSDVILLALPPVLNSLHHVKASPHPLAGIQGLSCKSSPLSQLFVQPVLSHRPEWKVEAGGA